MKKLLYLIPVLLLGSCASFLPQIDIKQETYNYHSVDKIELDLEMDGGIYPMITEMIQGIYFATLSYFIMQQTQSY